MPHPIVIDFKSMDAFVMARLPSAFECNQGTTFGSGLGLIEIKRARLKNSLLVQ